MLRVAVHREPFRLAQRGMEIGPVPLEHRALFMERLGRKVIGKPCHYLDKRASPGFMHSFLKCDPRAQETAQSRMHGIHGLTVVLHEPRVLETREQLIDLLAWIRGPRLFGHRL